MKTQQSGEEGPSHEKRKSYRGNTYDHDMHYKDSRTNKDLKYSLECYRCGKRGHYQRLQSEAGVGEVWPPGTTQLEVTGVDKDGLDQRTGNKGFLGHKMYHAPRMPPVH